MRIQKVLNSDIVMIFDECTPHPATEQQAADSMRLSLRWAAQEFFFHKGYDKTTVEDIISKLHLAKGTFYHYFISKKDLLDALIRDAFGYDLRFLGVYDNYFYCS
jgi:AcrR family transcriptional regulator